MKEIDDILGEFISDLEEADGIPETIIENEELKPNVKKFEKLLEAFDISEGNMSKNIDSVQENAIKELEALQFTKDNIDITNEESKSIVNVTEMLDDHILVRECLREDIQTSRLVLKQLGESIATTDITDLNGQVTEAYASIKKANMLSMKELMSSYDTVSKTQNNIKKLASELKTLDNEEKSSEINNTQNNIFVGSPAELLQQLKRK